MYIRLRRFEIHLNIILFIDKLQKKKTKNPKILTELTSPAKYY